MIAWLAGTWLGKAVAGAVMLILALLGFWGLGRREGAQRERERARDDDYEHADDIRRRVERDADDRVRKHDDAGWRDRG